jgi:opacity protein-like surface antigen
MKVRNLFIATAAAAALGGASSVLAQANDGSGVTSRSFVPGKSRVSVGLSLGRSRYSAPCGATSLSCDSTDNSFQLYAGTMPSNFWGVELGYIDMGRISRAGGTTTAQGLNLSLVGKTPLWHSLGLFGRVGTTYGRTESTALLGSGVAQGTERGFGLSYGAGVSYDFTPRLSATLGWDSHDFQFAGSGRDPVRSTSLGLQYKY